MSSDSNAPPEDLTRASSEPRLVQGEHFAYELGPTLGKGKFGKVKGAVNTVTGQRVAVKIIKKSLVHDGNGSEVAREVRCLQAIDHPNVLTLHDVIDTTEKLFIVLDVALGGDFFEYILSLYGDGHTFSEDEGRAYLRQLVDGVEACHAVGIAHRDLKPENLLLREVQTPGIMPVQGTLLVSDFGLSNWFRSQNGTGPTNLLGTPCGSTKYAAPEIIQGKGMYVPSSIDVWSMGVILYIMFAGQFPFTEATMRCDLYKKYVEGGFAWPAHFNPDLVELCSGMLCVNPQARWTIAQIKQSRFWLTNLPAAPALPASPDLPAAPDSPADTSLDTPFNMTGMADEAHTLPTAMELSTDMDMNSPTFSDGIEEMEEMQYRSIEMDEVAMPVMTNSTVPEAMPMARMASVSEPVKCPRMMTEPLRQQAILRRGSGCPNQADEARKLEEEMATVRTKAAIETLQTRLSVRMKGASAEQSEDRSASAPVDNRSPERVMSPGMLSTADFGHTKKKYRLTLAAQCGASALTQVEQVVATLAAEMKEKGIQGYKCAVGRSQRDPDKVVRIEIAHEGNTTLLAARLEYCHGGSPVVCFVRKSGCAFDFHRYFSKIKEKLLELGANETPCGQSPQSTPIKESSSEAMELDQ